MNILVQQLSPGQTDAFKKVIILFADVFERENFTLPDEAHLSGLLENPLFNVFAAFHEKEIIGAITVYTLDQYYSEKPLAFIYDLAVSVNYQRKGIGKELIQHVCDHYRNKGFEEIFVPAEEEDLHALDFYRKTDPTSEVKVRHFNYRL